MSESEIPKDPDAKPQPKSFLKSLKEAMEHGKAAATAIVLLLTAGMSLYHFFKPETEARVSYETLKPVVETTANDVRELHIRLDYMEKLLLLQGYNRVSRTGGVAIEGHAVRPSSRPAMAEGEGENLAEDAGHPTLVVGDIEAHDFSNLPAPVDLPDAPWEQQAKKK